MTTKRYLQISDLTTSQRSTGLLPISAPTWWRLVKQGAVPAPFKLSPGTTVWDAEEVEAAIAALKAKWRATIILTGQRQLS